MSNDVGVLIWPIFASSNLLKILKTMNAMIPFTMNHPKILKHPPRKKDSKCGDEMPSKETAYNFDPVNGKSKTWTKRLPRRKDHSDAHTEFNQASPTIRKEVENENNKQNGAVTVSSNSPNMNNVVGVKAEADNYDQL